MIIDPYIVMEGDRRDRQWWIVLPPSRYYVVDGVEHQRIGPFIDRREACEAMEGMNRVWVEMEDSGDSI